MSVDIKGRARGPENTHPFFLVTEEHASVTVQGIKLRAHREEGSTFITKNQKQNNFKDNYPKSKCSTGYHGIPCGSTEHRTQEEKGSPLIRGVSS